MAMQHEETQGNGERFEEAGRQVREAAAQARNAAKTAAGAISERAETLLKGMERAKDQILDGDVASVRSDLEAVIRKRPMGALLVGATIGYVLARMMRR